MDYQTLTPQSDKSSSSIPLEDYLDMGENSILESQ